MEGCPVTTDNAITAVAGVLVLLPNTAALVAGLTLTPGEQFVLLILSLIGAALLKQSKPAGKPKALSAADVDRLAKAVLAENKRQAAS